MTNKDYIIHLTMFIGILFILIVHDVSQTNFLEMKINNLKNEIQSEIEFKKNDNMKELWIHSPCRLYIELDPNMKGIENETFE